MYNSRLLYLYSINQNKSIYQTFSQQHYAGYWSVWLAFHDLLHHLQPFWLIFVPLHHIYVCMCVCVCICMCVYIYIYVCMCVRARAYMYIRMYVLIYEGWLKSFKTDFFIQNQMTLQALQFFLFQSSVLHIEYIFYGVL